MTLLRCALALLLFFFCGQPVLSQGSQTSAGHGLVAQGALFDTSGLKPVPGGDNVFDQFDELVDTSSVWDGVLNKALVGMGVGAIAMALTLAFVFARRAGQTLWRWLKANSISRAKVVRIVLAVGGLLVLYGVVSSFRYDYLPLSGCRCYIQIDSWTGEKRACEPDRTGISCSDWE